MSSTNLVHPEIDPPPGFRRPKTLLANGRILAAEPPLQNGLMSLSTPNLKDNISQITFSQGM